MHQCSESIGAIAAALAKAQSDLTNPEKSLIATIIIPALPSGGRTFRYAPLSSGLDIVRKCLGRQEIAVVQTTAIDTAAALVRLTTVLAHSSGEWISSEWPVCAVSETVAPQRMGAALTYARRYALFTLIGIAGEDDLDAPDLNGTPDRKQPSAVVSTNSGFSPRVHRHDARISPSKPVLDSKQSAMLRDQLLAQINGLASNEEAAHWARHGLADKNRLTTADANVVEAAFRASVTAFDADTESDAQRNFQCAQGSVRHKPSTTVARPAVEMASTRACLRSVRCVVFATKDI